MNYIDTFIQIADDCPVSTSVVPECKAGKKTVAVIQYEMLARNPYLYTQEDVLFQTHVRQRDLSPEERGEQGAILREEFFSQPRACLRTSPLAKKYGWGFHFDREGKVALYPMESKEYRELAQGEESSGPTVLKAMRSRRG